MKDHIPDFQSIMYPVLNYLDKNSPRSTQDIVDYGAEYFKLSEEDLRVLLPSGKVSLFRNRVGWAVSYLKNAGLLANVKRGVYQITDLGKTIAEQAPEYINIAYLNRIPGFSEWRKSFSASEEKAEPATADAELRTPEELIGEAFEKIQAALALELLDLIKQKTATQFEKFVLVLLSEMGYGTENNFEVVGQSGDNGIDGIVYQDRLGIERIYVQAKRWTDTKVSSKEVRDFIGSLSLKGTNKGVFITTSDFTQDALNTVNINPQNRIILIDGKKLAELAIQHNVGVQVKERLEMKSLDVDFFEDL